MLTGKAMELSLPKRTMKNRVHRKWSLGLALAVLPVAGSFQQESFSQPLNTTPGVEAAAASPEAAAPAPAVVNALSAAQTTEDDTVDAPAQPISTVKPLPPGVRLTGPVAEVLRLAESGVEESVILAFVTNSTSTFNLGAEEIIYLNDNGVSSRVVTAMIQRDQVLRGLSANGAGVAPAPAPEAAAAPATEVAPGLPTGEMAPQPDYTTGAYAPTADGTYATFYDSLAPYGTWVDVDGYGPCWQPTVVIVNPGWQPYCNGGSWVYTDCGWYWLSGYSWGWAPFHYGRWFHHHHLGWCWQPGNTWGPSWVCWRYGGNYCGWAPLPPAAGFSAGAGLTFHGQRVNSAFGFGVSASSYTFVPTSHFSDRHLKRYALSRQRAAQIYNQTVPSATIVGNHTRVVNRGIPVSRVEAATGTQIPRVGIREVNSAGAPGLRGERLDGNSRTLSVVRPQFPQSTGAQSAPGEHAQPGASEHSRSDIRPGSIRAAATPAPLILRGPDSARRAADWGSLSDASKGAPPNSLIVIGKREYNRSHVADLGNSLATESTWSRPAAQRQGYFARAATTQRSQAFTTAGTEAPAQPRWSIPGATEPRARTESQQRYSAPAQSDVPIQVPRSLPAPTPTPQPMRSYSPPAASPARPAEPPVSQPAYSAPSAPAPSAPAAHSSSSPGKGGR
jgi:hypothetical protein